MFSILYVVSLILVEFSTSPALEINHSLGTAIAGTQSFPKTILYNCFLLDHYYKGLC